MSWNTLEIAGELGINRVVVASSVNSIGMSASLLSFSLISYAPYLPELDPSTYPRFHRSLHARLPPVGHRVAD
jgi:hypothetical protein